MKRIRLSSFAMALSLLVLATCGLDRFDITEESTTTIRKGTLLESLVGDLGFSELAAFDIPQNQTLQNQGVSRNQIDSVHITRLNLTVIMPEGGDLSFLEGLEFFVSSEGLQRQRIASASSFPEGQGSIDLMIDDVNLADYVAAPSMQITTEATGRRPDEDTQIKATIDLAVDVDVGGALCG